MKRTAYLQKYGPWAVVAGASEGIGRAFATQLAARGFNLVLIARRAAPLEQLGQEIRQQFGVEVAAVPLDLSSPDLEATAHEISANYPDIGLLVYNACYSDIGHFFDTDLASKQRTIDVNCRGPLAMIHALVPTMLKRGRGGVILMSSMSGFQGSAMVATYAATKAFNTVLAEGLWEELQGTGIDVLAMVAGATSTPNFQSSTPQDKQSMTFPMQPEAVAKQALNDLGNGPTSIAGPINKAVHFVFRHLASRRAATRFFARTTRKVYDT